MPARFSLAQTGLICKFLCLKQPKKAFSKLDWLLELCKSKDLEKPKTILFWNTMKDVATLINQIMWKLGSSAFFPQNSRKPEDCLLGIYHSSSWEKYKERLVADHLSWPAAHTLQGQSERICQVCNLPMCCQLQGLWSRHKTTEARTQLLQNLEGFVHMSRTGL